MVVKQQQELDSCRSRAISEQAIHHKSPSRVPSKMASNKGYGDNSLF